MSTGISRAAVLTSAALLFGFPAAARALAVTSFAPTDVTLGTRLTIKGDFAELEGAGKRARPKVQGRRPDTSKTVKFEVLAFSRRTIIARVRAVPSTKSDPAAGKTWSLIVRSPRDGGEIAEADELFTTVGPLLVSLPDAEAQVGDELTLYALDPGEKPPSVTVGSKKAKVVRNAPAGSDRDGDPWTVRFRAPKLRNGFHWLRLENSLGRAPGAASLLIYGGTAGGVAPDAEAALEGRPKFDTPLCTWSEGDGRVRVEACAGDSCERALSVEFAPGADGVYVPAEIRFTDVDPAGDSAPSWTSTSAGAKLLPSPSPDLLAGAFSATLQPDGDPRALPIRIRGYFQARPSDSTP